MVEPSCVKMKVASSLVDRNGSQTPNCVKMKVASSLVDRNGRTELCEDEGSL